MSPAIEPGALVQIDPASALWAMGARWGEVLRVDRGNRRRPSRALVSLPKLGRQWLPLNDVMECD